MAGFQKIYFIKQKLSKYKDDHKKKTQSRVHYTKKIVFHSLIS